jgi:signal transduction histidine kinase
MLPLASDSTAMSSPLPPPDEAERLAELHAFHILDTPPEQAFDDLVALAAEMCDAPIALITILDATRQWYKAKVGLETTETPRDIAFCSHAIGQPDLLVVPDAAADERFARNPLVTGEPNIRFYAGAPLVTASGHALGALCVIDRKPRQFSPEQARILRLLSRQAMAQIELRRTLEERSRAEGELARANAQLELRLREKTAELNALREGSRAEAAERSLAEEAIRRRSDQLLRFEASLLKLVTASHPNLEVALRQITEVSAHTLGVERVSVWLFDEDRTELRCRAVYLLSGSAEESNFRFGAADCPTYFAELNKRLTIAADDAQTDPRTRELAEIFLNKMGVRALLAVPIRLRGDMVGVLSHSHTRGVRSWNQEEQDFANAVAGVVALELEAEGHRHLETQLHALTAHLESVREQERKALARELHDELGQVLTALRMDTASIMRACKERPDTVLAKAPPRLAAMKELIDQAVATVQRISSDLRPGVLDELGLVDAMDYHIQEFAKRSGIHCEFTPPQEEIALDNSRSLALYRAMQEALTNVARHAGATDVHVFLRLSGGDAIAMEVRDNGRGIPLDAIMNSKSFGLIGMRERALSLGGQAVFSRNAKKGTVVTVKIPLEKGAVSPGDQPT